MRIAWRSRWVIVPGLILGVTLGWNGYVALHAGGSVAGRVVDAAGAPVAGAAVMLYERSFITNNESQRTVTGPDGAFRFEGNASHAVQLQAEAPGMRSARVTLRLWFRAQDAVLPSPIRLAARVS